MRFEIKEIQKELGITVVYVTHDQTEAMTLGDRIVIMKDGYVNQTGTPQDLFDRPVNLFVAGFIGMPVMNFFDANLVKEGSQYFVEVGGYRQELAPEKEERLLNNNVQSQPITLGVRPEHTDVSDQGIAARVDVAEMMGSSVHLHVTILGKDVIVIVSTMNMTGAEVAALAAGAQVNVAFPGSVCHVFNKETGINLEF